MLLTNKVVLLTGGAGGIGRSIVQRMASEGAHIAFTYLTGQEQAEILLDELAQEGIKCKGYLCDGADFKAVHKLVEQVIKDFGGVDILINNAGITRDNLLVRMTEEQWDQVISVNLKSVFNLSRAVIKQVMRAHGGSIINITSVMGIRGNAGQANYAASKAGIIGFTKSIALEMAGRNIRVNAIAPGFIETSMTATLSDMATEKWTKAIPMKRTGKPAEVANACVFLASDLSSYITGQVLQVDGGMRT